MKINPRTLIGVIFLVQLIGLVSTEVKRKSTHPDPANFLNGISQVSKRLLWMNKRRKFVLPTGTVLTVAPKITLPVFRNKPFNGGLNSDIQASWYFYSESLIAKVLQIKNKHSKLYI